MGRLCAQSRLLSVFELLCVQCSLSVCVLCGFPVWPSPPVVDPLWGPPLCVGPLCGSPVRFPCVGPLCGSPVRFPCVGPLCGSPVWVPCVGPLCGSLVVLRLVASTRVMSPARSHAPAYNMRYNINLCIRIYVYNMCDNAYMYVYVTCTCMYVNPVPVVCSISSMYEYTYKYTTLYLC